MRVFNLDQLKHVFRSYVIILCCKRGGKYGFHRKTRLFAFFIIGFSQLSDMEFFVDPKNEMSETEIHPLCGWE